MNVYHRLDDVQMSAIDREHAKAHMRSAELTIDFVAAVVARTRLISAALGRLVSQPGAADSDSPIVERRNSDTASIRRTSVQGCATIH